MLIQNFGRWVVECVRSRVGRGNRRRRRSLGSLEALEQRTLLMAFSEFVDPNPSVGNGFGAYVVPLSTGNVVVMSPYDDAGGTDAGAVYLFNGATGAPDQYVERLPKL